MMQGPIVATILIAGLFFGCSKKSSNAQSLDRFEVQSYKSEQRELVLKYRLYSPNQTTGKYPLVLYLHGGGARGDDNKSQLELGAMKFASDSTQKENPCFVLAPQCPKNKQWLNTRFPSIPFTNYRQEEIPESGEMKSVVELIETLGGKLPIDENRIYVTGVSMGASGTWDIIARYPELFASAVPVNGVSDPDVAQRISHIPIWAFHGEQDAVSSVENTRKMITALKAAGSRCRYTEFKGMGHSIADKAYGTRDLISWLFSKRKKGE